MIDSSEKQTPNFCPIPCRYEHEIKEVCKQILITDETITKNSELSNLKIDSLKEKIGEVIIDISSHIKQGSKWRLAIVGIVFSIILEVFGFMYMFGRLVESNEQQGKQIDLLIRRVVGQNIVFNKEGSLDLLEELSFKE
jgi:hypothetical protein